MQLRQRCHIQTVHSLCLLLFIAVRNLPVAFRMFSYHVTLGLVKKVVSLATKECHLLVEAVAHCFDIPSDSFIIQKWDTDFDDWTNLTDAESLPDKGKLMVVLHGK